MHKKTIVWFLILSLLYLPHMLTPECKDTSFSMQNETWPQKGKKDSVHFYKRGEDYYEFANTYNFPVTIDGATWKSTEYYYQAQKFWKPLSVKNDLEKISPGQLQGALRKRFNKGRKNKNKWESENKGHMLTALWEKFKDPTLRKLLLGTGNKIIVEDAGTNDSFYGAGEDYTGCNHLGQMLMTVRQAIRNGIKNRNDLKYTPHPPSYWHQQDQRCTDKSFTMKNETWPKKDPSNAIHFYHSGQPYEEFTNTYEGTIIVNGTAWQSLQHYYQAQKFINPGAVKNILEKKFQNPADVQKAAAQKKYPFDGKNFTFKENWFDESKDHMLTALRAKFKNQKLRQLLLDTGNKILVEDDEGRDPFYGAGKYYNGCNHLGQMLMHIRREIVKNKTMLYQPRSPKDWKKLFKEDEITPEENALEKLAQAFLELGPKKK